MAAFQQSAVEYSQALVKELRRTFLMRIEKAEGAQKIFWNQETDYQLN